MPVASHYYLSSEARTDLPASLSREIGRIIIKWANLEHKAQQIIRTLAQITIPIGLVVAREPRLEDRITIIEQLSEFLGISLSADALSDLSEGARLLAAKRHALAHGIWVKERGVWNLVISRGQWEDEDSPTEYKSILPECTPVTARSLSTILTAINILDKLLSVISVQVGERLQAPPEVHPSQYPRRNPKPNRGASKHKTPRAPSLRSARKAKRLSSAQRRKMAQGKMGRG